MRRLLGVVVALLAIAGAIAIVFGLITIRGGFTARAKASRVEAAVAETLRDLATPRSARSLRSPVVGTPDVLTHSRRHFASECAPCHGNDGKGADFGKRLFPPVPNLRDDTRDLTEGEIFWIIENGIRWSGMPTFAEPDDPEETHSHWEVVYFIRHLPDLTGAEIEEMKRYNPRSQAGAETMGAPADHGMHMHGGGASAPAAPGAKPQGGAAQPSKPAAPPARRQHAH